MRCKALHRRSGLWPATGAAPVAPSLPGLVTPGLSTFAVGAGEIDGLIADLDAMCQDGARP